MFVYIHRATSTSLIRVWAPSGSRTQQLETCIVLKGVAAAAKSLLSCLTLCDPIDSIPRGSRPWDSPGKNTGVGCHFLLQCMKVKSENEVAQSCPTLSDPMDWSPPGSSVHGISRQEYWSGMPLPSPLKGVICTVSPLHFLRGLL